MILWIAIIASITCFFGVTFALFLLYLGLKIKSDFPEPLRLEIDKHREVYEFIRERGKVTPAELVKEFERTYPENPKYPLLLERCEHELNERCKGKFRTLVRDEDGFRLSDDVKMFFIYENPTLRELLRYIFYVYFKHQPEKVIPH